MPEARLKILRTLPKCLNPAFSVLYQSFPDIPEEYSMTALNDADMMHVPSYPI